MADQLRALWDFDDLDTTEQHLREQPSHRPRAHRRPGEQTGPNDAKGWEA